MLALALLLASRADAGGDLVLRNARVVDALGARDVEVIVVRDGWITAMGEAVAAGEVGGLPSLDVAGGTVLPGLIESHAHVSVSPASGLRDDPPALTEELTRRHLRGYLACGVTTVVDPGILPDAAAAIDGWVAAGQPAPRTVWIGPLVSPAGGYPGSFIPHFSGVSSAADVRALMEGWDALAPAGVKVTFERGQVGRIWPLLADEAREAVVAEAAARGLPIYAHAMSAEEYRRALEVEPHAIVHGVQSGARGLAKTLAARGVFVVSTISIADTLLVEFEPERLDRRPWRGAVPDVERASGLDPATARDYREGLGAVLLPRAAPWLRRAAGDALGTPAALRGRVRAWQRQIRILHEAGVPIVLGSDSGAWPLFPWGFHGPTSVRELELLVEAGLTPAEAIDAATIVPARMLGLDHEIGAVRAGMRADLVVVAGDPLSDISVLRAPLWTVRDGVARTPEAWFASEAP